MKKVTKIAGFLAAMVLTAGIAAGCGGGQAGIDKTKTQLYIYNYDGGIGSQWLDDAVAKFTAANAEVAFEPGTSKKGVQVIVAQGQDNIVDLKDSPYNVFCTEQVYYNDFISKGQLLDITDIVTQKSLSEASGGKETGTVADKLFDEQKTTMTALDGKYYVLPHYETYSGLTYDKTVFAREGSELYFKEGGGWTAEDSEKTVGPDGIRGNYDDGLPSSYEEFNRLLTRMSLVGVTPFIWTGGYPYYTNHLVTGLWAAYTGKDEFGLNFNFGTGDGQVVETEIVTDFAGGVPQTDRMPITPQTGYLTRQQAGQYYALDFLSKVMSNDNFYSDKINAALSHMDAQREFIYSDLENRPIAMIVEGSYWYNEASQAFKSSANTYKARGTDRDFAWMPLPRQLSGSVTEGNGTKNVLLDSVSSFCFINGNIKNNANLTALAKLFLQFLYTDELLTDFMLSTGVSKGVNFTVDPAKAADMNKYYRSVYEIRAVSDIVRPYSGHPIFINAQSAFFLLGPASYWSSTVGSTPYNSAHAAFKAGVSAQNYFKGLWSDSDKWQSQYGKYIAG